MQRARHIMVVGLILLACPGIASAQQAPPTADIQLTRGLFADAKTDEATGRWETALEKLERAAEIEETVEILLHIARCREHLGLLRGAETGYMAALELARAEDDNEVITAASASLAMLRPRIPIIRVVAPEEQSELDVSVLEVMPTGDELYVNLDSVPRAAEGSYELAVNPGDYVVSVRARGKRTLRVERRLPEGETVTVNVKLEAEPPSVPPVERGARAPSPARDAQGFWSTKNTVSVALLGTGLASAVVGAGVASHTDEHEAIALGFYAAGGMLVWGALASWVLWPNAQTKRAAGPVVPMADPGRHLLGIRGVF